MIQTSYVCAYCSSVNEIVIDTTGGRRQQYVEDCQTCCRPNVLTIEIEGSGGEDVWVEAARESD